MRREQVELGGDAARGTVIAHGHWGRPVLVFPAEAGHAWDPEVHGLVDAVADLVEAGRVKLYCVDSFDAWTWSDRTVDLEERARRHGAYEAWLLEHVLPWVSADCGGASEFVAVGTSMGAYHAANLALKRADLFPVAICLSGNYDPTTWHGWGERGEAVYLNNPFDHVAGAHGDHLEWLRARAHLLLVVGQGAFEVQPTQALPSTRAFAELLAAKGIPHELDVWGYDVPHDWSSWRRQLAHHLPRLC